MDKAGIYLFFFLFVVGYSTFTVLYTTYGFITAGTFDMATFIIRLIALSFIYVMFAMFLDILRLFKQR